MPSHSRAARRKTVIAIAVAAVVLTGASLVIVPRVNFTGTEPGGIIDDLHGVSVYNNGAVSSVHGRNMTADGYNVGLEYQCVEFVKRYYLELYDHRMPDSYGHARDFFDPTVPDGGLNARRALTQYTNGSRHRPRKGDLIVFGPTLYNRYGHVAIISQVWDKGVEITQQNSGTRNGSRRTMTLKTDGGRYFIKNRSVRGWLRMPHPCQSQPTTDN